LENHAVLVTIQNWKQTARDAVDAIGAWWRRPLFCAFWRDEDAAPECAKEKNRSNPALEFRRAASLQYAPGFSGASRNAAFGQRRAD
jgi:hypothetical protein